MNLFDSWAALARVALNAALIFVVLIALIRLSGKRAMAKMNNFDWLVTVAVGALMAQAVLGKSIPLAEAVVAIAMLLAMQHIATRLATRFAFARDALLSQPTLLYYDGAFLEEAMRRERVTHREVRSAMRSCGYTNVGEVGAVVLEPDGDLNALRRQTSGQQGGAGGKDAGDKADGDDLLEDVRHASDPLAHL